MERGAKRSTSTDVARWEERLDAALSDDKETLLNLIRSDAPPDPDIARMLDDLFSGRAQCVRIPER